MRIILGTLCALTLCGCGPSAQQQAAEQAAQQARQKYHEAVAAVKVCTQGATYREFREKRLALETCYTANQAALAGVDGWRQLSDYLKATDVLWEWQNRNGGSLTLPSGNRPGDATWEAMLVITPAVAAKQGFTYEQCAADRDFFAANYVKRGLGLVSRQCDSVLRP